MPKNVFSINFIGNYAQGYVGEVADEVMLARDLEKLGHKVNRVPRDQWKAYVDGDKPNDDWNLPKKADVNIIAKWHHFNNGKYISELNRISEAPVIYWTWDYMPYDGSWHEKMVYQADLYLTNEGGRVDWLNKIGYRAYYFPFDVADGELNQYDQDYKYDVVFTGSHLGQGVRVPWIKEINESFPVTVFSWNYEEWKKEGIEAYPAVYGDDFNNVIASSKIVLQFSVNDHCWGYWSNRTGKVLTAGGFLLARYAPGMELFLRDGIAYFSRPFEAIKKIEYYLDHEDEREVIRRRGHEIGRQRFTSIERMKDLEILIDRFLEGGLL